MDVLHVRMFEDKPCLSEHVLCVVSIAIATIVIIKEG